MPSWVDSANTADTHFPLNNLPYGIFSINDMQPRCGVRIGNMVLDLNELEMKGYIEFTKIILCESTHQPIPVIIPT